MHFDTEHIRKQFPILGERIYNKPLVYLDNAATTQRPIQVVDKMVEASIKYNSNIHRGVHFLSQKATQAHEDARETIRGFINAASDREIIFTRGTTESINLVAFSFGDKYCSKGDEILISAMEHHSNIVPWQMLCERKGLVLKVIPFDDRGVLDMQAFDALLSTRTRLVAVTHVSNALGTINPVKTIIEKAHANGSVVLMDAAQSVPHFSIDVQQLDVDFLVFSSHKMYGPTGIGVLYGKESILADMPPYQGGGEMIETVTFEKTTYNGLPFRFEAGTPDFTASVAFAEAVRFLQGVGVEAMWQHEHDLLQYATQQLNTIDGMRIYGESPDKSSVISFLVNNIHPFDMGTLLDKMGIAVRTGHHCAQPVMDRFQIPGTVRASFAVYNTRDEVDALVAGVRRIAAMFQ